MSQNHNQLLRRSVSRRTVLRGSFLGGAGLGTALLFGCGGDDDSENGTTSSSPTPAGVAGPKRGGTLVVAFPQDVTTLDPHTGVSGFDANYLHALYDSLVGYDAEFKSDADRSLASGWEIQDPQTISFSLREAVFHDESPVTSEVIKWNLERILAPDTKAQNRAQLLIIDRIETPDDKTLTFKLKSPAADLISALGSRGSLIISRQGFERHGAQFGSNPVGSGPFRFKSRTVGSSVVVERNPQYWGKDADGNAYPYVDSLEMRYLQDPTARAVAIRAGDVAWVEPAAKDLAAFRKDKSFQVLSLEGGRVGHVLQYNYGLAPMDDENLRAAIAWAENQQAIVDGAFFGEARVADAGHWPPQTWAYASDSDHPKYDVNKAKEYLAKSRYAGEKIKITTFNVPEQLAAIQIVQDNLKAIGVDSELITGDIGQIAAAYFQNQSAHIFSSSFGLYPEPNHISQNVFSSKGSQNAGAIMGAGQDEDIDALIAKGRTVYDVDERKPIYAELDRLVTKRAKPTVVQVYQAVSFAASSKLGNAQSALIADGWLRFHQVSLNS